jgi:hypothetical protein
METGRLPQSGDGFVSLVVGKLSAGKAGETRGEAFAIFCQQQRYHSNLGKVTLVRV